MKSESPMEGPWFQIGLRNDMLSRDELILTRITGVWYLSWSSRGNDLSGIERRRRKTM